MTTRKRMILLATFSCVDVIGRENIFLAIDVISDLFGAYDVVSVFEALVLLMLDTDVQ